MHEDRRIQGDHVVAALDHRPLPLGLDVVLQQDAVVAVVVRRRESAVDLRGLEDEAAPLAESDDLLHGHDVVSHVRTVAGEGLGKGTGGYTKSDSDAHLRHQDNLALRRVDHLADNACERPAASRLATFGTPILGAPMPIYEYRCENGHTFEVMQRMTDDALTECSVCGAPVQRVFHPVAIHFKGSGFYNTDYGKRKRGASAAEKDGGSDSKSDSKSESKSESKTDSKKSESTTSSSSSNKS